MKLVINICYGTYSLSDKALEMLGINCGQQFNICRNDTRLIEVVETLGKEANDDDLSKLKVIEIPDEATDYTIQQHDGCETVIYVLNGKLYFNDGWDCGTFDEY